MRDPRDQLAPGLLQPRLAQPRLLEPLAVAGQLLRQRLELARPAAARDVRPAGCRATGRRGAAPPTTGRSRRRRRPRPAARPPPRARDERDHAPVVGGDEHHPGGRDDAGEHRADRHDDDQSELPADRAVPQQPRRHQPERADPDRAHCRHQHDLHLVARHRRRLPPIAHAPHRLQPLRPRGVPLDLLPQPAYVHGHRRVVADRPAPDLLQQVLARVRRTRVREQEAQQVELTHGQGEHRTVAGRHVGGLVDDQVAVDQPLRRRGGAGTTQHGVDPQDQLARAERLADVVVRAGLETHHPVGLLPQRGQHDHGHVAAGPQPTADLQAVDAGQHQVEHDQVGGGVAHHAQRGLAVGRLDHLVLVGAQVGDDHLTHGVVVVDHQDAGHGYLLLASVGRRRRRPPPGSARRAPTIPPVVAVEQRGVVGPGAEPPEHRYGEQRHRPEHHEPDHRGRAGRTRAAAAARPPRPAASPPPARRRAGRRPPTSQTPR